MNPSIHFAAASLLFFFRSSQLANAQNEDAAESFLIQMEEYVKEIRDEIERVYNQSRCENETLAGCINNTYNDCLSTFPNQQCIKPDEFVVSNCWDGYSCNGECDQRR